jgi:hypothetical protein
MKRTIRCRSRGSVGADWPIRTLARSSPGYLSDHGLVQSETECFAATMARALGIDTDELKICIAEGRIGSALVDRFKEPENTTDIGNYRSGPLASLVLAFNLPQRRLRTTSDISLGCRLDAQYPEARRTGLVTRTSDFGSAISNICGAKRVFAYTSPRVATVGSGKI